MIKPQTQFRIQNSSASSLLMTTTKTGVALLMLIVASAYAASPSKSSPSPRQLTSLCQVHTTSRSSSLLRGGSSSVSSTTNGPGTFDVQTKFSIVGDLVADPLVTIAPLIVGVVCRDGVLLVALHPGYNSDGEDESDDYENYLRMGPSRPTTAKNKKRGRTGITSSNVNISKYSSTSPPESVKWYDVIDVPPTYRGPFRIHVLQDECSNPSSELDSYDSFGSAGSGSAIAMVSAGWRSDAQYLASVGMSIIQQDKEMFGTSLSPSSPSSSSTAFMTGQYISGQLSYAMAHQAVGTEKQRPFSCASLIASAASTASVASTSSSSASVQASTEIKNNGFLWLVDSTGIYQVRGHSIGGGDVITGGDGKPTSSVTSIVNTHLVQTDWTKISSEDAARNLLKFLFLPASVDVVVDENGDETDTVSSTTPSQKQRKSWTVPKGTRAELAVIGTSQRKPFKRIFASTLFREDTKRNMISPRDDDSSLKVDATMNVRGGGGGIDSITSSPSPIIVGELKVGQSVQESYIEILDETLSSSSRIRLKHDDENTKKDVYSDLELLLSQTFALLCDIVILDLTSETDQGGSIDLSRLVSAMNRGVGQRTTVGLDMGVLVVIAGASASDSQWVQHFVSSDLASIQPRKWSQLEIVESSDKVMQFLKGRMQPDVLHSQGASSLAMLAPNEGPDTRTELVMKIFQKTVDAKKSLKSGTSVSFQLESQTKLSGYTDGKRRRKQDIRSDTIGSFPISSKDPSDVLTSILADSRTVLDILESQMQSVELESMSSNPIPVLDFGRVTNEVLNNANNLLEQARKSHNLSRTLCRSLLDGIIKKVSTLYEDQIRSLRNYYGQRYEDVLLKSSMLSNREKAERQNADAAQRMLQEFQVAAKNAIPRLDSSLMGGEDISLLFNYSKDLQGLIQDMMDATERVQDDKDLTALLQSDVDDDEKGDRRGRFFLPGRNIQIPKWVERIAARALVFGVNYVQGWLAWQGIKHAALEREKKQPKFPLF